MELNRYVGAQIKKFREARNMTQDDLAEKLLTTRQTVSRYENGDRKTNQDILFELANIFHVQVDDFFPDRKDKVKESNLYRDECLYTGICAPHWAYISQTNL